MALRGGQEVDFIAEEPIASGQHVFGSGPYVAPGNPFHDPIAEPGRWVDFAIGQLLGTGLRIPVGPPVDRRDNRLPPVPKLFKVVPKPREPIPILKEVVGRGLPQIKEVLPVQAAIPIPSLPQVRTGPSSEDGGPSPTTIEHRSAKMPDLGSLFEGHFGLPGWEGIADVGANLLGYGGPTVTNVPISGSGGTIAGSVPVPQGNVMPAMGGGGCERDPRNDYVLKFICSQWKWVKKRRRRSKRLATSSDIKDLSSLKGVLGDGKNLSTWIATHR